MDYATMYVFTLLLWDIQIISKKASKKASKQAAMDFLAHVFVDIVLIFWDICPEGEILGLFWSIFLSIYHFVPCNRPIE